MNYSLEKISTVAACEALLVQARSKKQSLERRRRNLGEAIDAFRKQMNEIGPDLALTRLMLDTFTTASVAMPEGKDKMRTVIKVKQLEARQAVMEQKAQRYHVHALLAKEVAHMQLDSQVSVMEHYIDAVETLRATLDPLPAAKVSMPVMVLSEADAVAKTAAVTPEAAVWQTVVEAYLNTSGAPVVMSPRRTIDEVDNLLVNTPVRRTGRVPWPLVPARPHSTMSVPLGTADPVPDEFSEAYSA